MEHDVKEGWCVCGEYHKRVQKLPRKPEPKKVVAPKKAKKATAPKPPAALPEELPPSKKDDDDFNLKYPFGAPRIF